MVPVWEVLRGKRLVFDGSMGALIGQRGIVTNCPDILSLEKPEAIRAIHRDYLNAGADVIIADTFGSHPAKLARNGYEDRMEETVAAAVANARAEAGEKAFVALDVGPTGQLMAPVGTFPREKAIEGYARQIRAGRGADFAFLETMTDIAEARAAMLACRAEGIPFAASFSFEENGRTVMGGAPECAALIANALGAFAAGCNCSGGPATMHGPIRAMQSVCGLPLIVQPNAGMPEVADGRTVYPYDAERFAAEMRTILDMDVECAGGCCGTTPAHIEALSRLAAGYAPVCRESKEERYVCSQRVYAKLADALENSETVSDPDDLYDLDDGTLLAFLDIRGMSAEDAESAADEASLATNVPLGFIADSAEALEAALRAYAGVAAVKAEGDLAEIVARYGAVMVE